MTSNFLPEEGLASEKEVEQLHFSTQFECRANNIFNNPDYA